MRTVRDLITLSVEYLMGKGIASPRRSVEELLAHILSVKRVELYMDIDRPVEEGEIARCREGVALLGKRTPVQYLIGTVEFMGCKLTVDERALIPRPETELLAHKVAKALEAEGPDGVDGKKLWDICTGSGCLGIALKKRFPTLDVTVSDLSPEALSLAKENAIQNGVNIRFLQGDLFAPFAGEQADVILCNPPYVTESEYVTLEPEVRDHEPRLALVGGETGIEFYTRLAQGLHHSLAEEGSVYLELGSGQGPAVLATFRDAGWEGGVVEQDWSRHDRFFSLERA